MKEVSSLLRDNVLLPLASVGEVPRDATSGIQLPAWHCAFKGCKGQAAARESKSSGNCSYERGFWTHLSDCHGASLKVIARKWGLIEQQLNPADVYLTLYNAGLAERERNSVPELGASIDRRVMAHVRKSLERTLSKC